MMNMMIKPTNNIEPGLFTNKLVNHIGSDSLISYAFLIIASALSSSFILSDVLGSSGEILCFSVAPIFTSVSISLG